MTDIDIDALRDIVVKYAAPDPAIVTQVNKGGANLDAVGHAEVTRILCQIDPGWTWVPQAWAPEGGPLIQQETCYLPVKRGEDPTSRPVEMVIMWGFLTIFGKTLPCVGTCEAHKPEGHKELISDLLRNGAMRFGIALNLWSKAEMAEAGYEAEEREPEPEDFHGWPSRADHDAAWRPVEARLRALGKPERDGAVARLIEDGLFGADRKPRLPYDDVQMDAVTQVVAIWERGGPDAVAAALMAETGPSDHAIEVMAAALGCDDPVNAPPVELEPFMWDLAGVTDLDAHDWKPTAKAFGLTQKALLVEAAKCAEKLGQPEPTRLDDIHGQLAEELRVALLGLAAPF